MKMVNTNLNIKIILALLKINFVNRVAECMDDLQRSVMAVSIKLSEVERQFENYCLYKQVASAR